MVMIIFPLATLKKTPKKYQNYHDHFRSAKLVPTPKRALTKILVNIKKRHSHMAFFLFVLF